MKVRPSVEKEAIVLLVDSEQGMLPVIEYICKKDNVKVVSACHSRVALKIAKQETPVLIILDISVNGDMSGLQLIKRLRRNSTTQETPIIVLTHKNSLPDRAAAMEHGGSDYLIKPFNPDFLHARIQALLKSKGLRK